MYSNEDLEIKCKSNTMKLASFVEMQPLLFKDFIFSIRLRLCPQVSLFNHFVSAITYLTTSFRNGTKILANELQHITDSKRELQRRTTISRSPINYSEDMPSDQKDRYIRYLIEQHEEKDLELRAMKLAVEEFQSIHDGVVESLARLEKEMMEIRSELSSERNKRKAAEARARKLDQQLKYAQKNRFGDKLQKARKDEKKEETAAQE